MEVVMQQKPKGYWQKNFFFKWILPSKKKLSRRLLLKGNLAFFNYTHDKIPVLREAISWKKKMSYLWKRKWFPFSFKRSLRRLRRIFYKLNKFKFHDSIFNYYLLGRDMPKILQSQTQRFEKNMFLTGAQRIFKNEKKTKYFSIVIKNYFLNAEKKNLKRNLLRDYLWISRKTQLSWKYKIFKPSRQWFKTTVYFWWSLQNTYSDLKWQEQKYILPKWVRFEKKNEKNWWEKKKHYHKRRKINKNSGVKQSWNLWVETLEAAQRKIKKPKSKKTKAFIQT